MGGGGKGVVMGTGGIRNNRLYERERGRGGRGEGEGEGRGKGQGEGRGNIQSFSKHANTSAAAKLFPRRLITERSSASQTRVVDHV